ncbi:alpha/beta hydrolase [Salarchaeum japonicum]|uniref:Dienelactone hydrolase family protein n=1 Tax=Salarchaeum japonicum TaxID=555573 RepID=A0AAV3T2H5_9EURY|nr:dienelactone hydrolase family protein [Salarchaeum japonicum]
MSTSDPHGDQQVVTAGTDLSEADAAVVLSHGRGATAQSVLSFANELPTDGVAYLAPQAARNTWYPQAFTAPEERNEPWLSSALAKLDSVVETVADAGIDRERTLVGGFSQGACLSSEYVARNPTRYGGLAVLSGGLIGDAVSEDDYPGSLDGTPAFLGCSDRDPHIDAERVRETDRILTAMDAEVDTRLYEGMGHTVIPDELDAVRSLVESL